MKTLGIQIDIGSRILSTRNLLEILNLFGSINEKKAHLKGKIIMANYGNFKTYKIEDINFEINPKTTFYLQKQDRKISYAQYFEETYGVKLKVMNQPLILVIIRIDRVYKDGKLTKYPI